MTTKRVGQWLLLLGLLGVTASLAADLLPGANPGIQAAQILGIELSAISLFLGMWLLLSGTTSNFEPLQQIRRLARQILDLPVIVWVLAGFLTAYLLLFISPLMLNDTVRIAYFNTYLPDRYPIGNDLIAVLNLMKGWFFEGKSPYDVQFYPPFTYIFLSPLLLVDYYPTLFIWFTLASVVFYILLTLVLPVKMTGLKSLPMILLLFLPGLVSYGFQFELERGQYNIFTFLLCLLSIYIFHQHKKYRILAYVLFSLSIQLKLYPAIFIVMFVDDWAEWRIVLRRFIGIGLANFALLFIMGWEIFLKFGQSVIVQITTPTWNTDVNHSIKSFVDTLGRGRLAGFPAGWQTFAQDFTGPISNTLTAIFLIAFVLAIFFSQFRKGRGIDMYLLFTCTIGALILPVSMDYKLSILTTPMALFFTGLPDIKSIRPKLSSALLIAGISLVYSSLLFPFKYKPAFLNNSFPPLFLLLIFTTILNFIHFKNSKS